MDPRPHGARMNANLPIIRLKPREGRRVRAGAPWVFSNEIVMEGKAKSLAPGTLVRLASDDGSLIGIGYFNPKSLIAVRLLGPPDAEIDTAFVRGKLEQALELRGRFYDTPFYRLTHAEGDALPGLVIDRFADALVVQITTAGMERLTDEVLAALDETIAPACIILRNDTPARALEGLPQYVRVARGEAPTRLVVEENGAHYFADPQAGQKSGWYYDQRDNRLFMAKLAHGKTCLDVYSYSGGFGILTAVNGARQSVFVDSSEPALQLAREAAEANGVFEHCRFVKAEAFAELERLAKEGQSFDIVICDPPPFAPSRKDVEAGARAYRKLARLAAAVVAPGGFLLLASCSYNVSLERFAAECAAGIHRGGRRAALVRQAGAGPDHPVHPLLPETAYLKALTFALD
jgi:23S rRNA (cytosine1962-C5)-methyltransferase